MGELAGLQRVTTIGLGASTPLPASTSAERNSCLHAAPRGSRGNVVRGLAKTRTRLLRRRGPSTGWGASSSGAFVISVSGHFSATALSPFLILSCLIPGRSGKDRPGSVGNTGRTRFGETESSSDRTPALRVCAAVVGGVHQVVWGCSRPAWEVGWAGLLTGQGREPRTWEKSQARETLREGPLGPPWIPASYGLGGLALTPEIHDRISCDPHGEALPHQPGWVGEDGGGAKAAREKGPRTWAGGAQPPFLPSGGDPHSFQLPSPSISSG